VTGVSATHPDRPPWRLDPIGRRWFDIGLAAALLLPVLAFPVAGYPWSWTVLCAVQITPLFWRRSHPMAVFLVVAAAHAAQVAVLDHALWGQVALPIALYSVARFSTAVDGALALAVAVIGAGLASRRWLVGYEEAGAGWGWLFYFVTLSTIVVTAWALGTLGRTRRAYVDALVERGQRIEREAAQQVELAALDERARIAREMHDVVAHGLTVMVGRPTGRGTPPPGTRRPPSARWRTSPPPAGARSPTCAASSGCSAPTTPAPPRCRDWPRSRTWSPTCPPT
jgi:signal transduction histidine kinase